MSKSGVPRECSWSFGVNTWVFRFGLEPGTAIVGGLERPISQEGEGKEDDGVSLKVLSEVLSLTTVMVGH